MYFMGVDVGSSGCKVSVIDEKGLSVCFASREYSFVYGDTGSHLNPNLVIKSVFSAIKELSDNNDLSDVKTVSVTSFGEMFVLMDKDKKVICDSITYDDIRGNDEAAYIRENFGDDKLYGITATTCAATYSLPKLMWIKKHQPEIYDKVRYMNLFADYVLFMMGAKHHTDYSLAARTMMLDIAGKCWSKEILDFAGIDENILGELVQTGTVVGEIDSSIADELSLPRDVKLLAGGHDQPCAALGAGIIEDGVALDGMGSNECIVPAFDSPMINATMKESNLVCVPYIASGKFVTYAYCRTAGSLFKWYNKVTGDEGYPALTSAMPDEPTDIYVLPHFMGATTPYMDDESVGAMIGLKVSHTKGEITRGIIEGLNYEMLVNLKCLEKSGFKVKLLRASGGLSKSDEILQIKADVLGIPVQTLEISETGTVGIAIMGTVAMGIYKDINEAVSNIVSVKKTFYPDMEKHEIYKDRFERYKKLYNTVKGFYKD